MSELHQRPLVRPDHLISEEVSGEYVVYDSLHKKAHHLNSTLTWIWKRCDGSTSVEALAAQFEQQFNATNSLDIVLTGLAQLESRELLQAAINIPPAAIAQQNAVSRRAVVVGGSVLMPAIVSILAPTAQAAKSGKDNPGKGKGKDNPGRGKGKGKDKD